MDKVEDLLKVVGNVEPTRVRLLDSEECDEPKDTGNKKKSKKDIKEDEE